MLVHVKCFHGLLRLLLPSIGPPSIFGAGILNGKHIAQPVPLSIPMSVLATMARSHKESHLLVQACRSSVFRARAHVMMYGVSPDEGATCTLRGT